MMIFFIYKRLENGDNSPEWNISGSLVESIEIDEEDTMCSQEAITIYVPHLYLYFNYSDEIPASLVNAMDTCRKLNRYGMNLTQIETKEQFKIWHQNGNKNKVTVTNLA